MADQKVSDLPSLSGADVDAADLLYIIDSSAGSAGSKKITVGQYQLAPVSGGTANGVVYLNGSKVVTTGSGLVFDGSNLGVGTNSPSAKLEVASGKVLLSNGQSYAVKNSGGAVNDVIGLSAGNVLILGGGGATDSIQFWNQGLQRMTLDASGNLLVGTIATGAAGIGISNGANLTFAEGSGASYVNLFRQSNSAATVLANGYKYTSTANGFASSLGTAWAKSAITLDGGNVIFYANGATTVANGTDVTPTERARITSGGDLLVGKAGLTNPTTTDGLIWYKNASGGGGTLYATNGGTGTSLVLGTQADTSVADFFRSGTKVGSISVTTTATAYNTSSDRRLKENIQPADDAGAVIDAIEIVQHDWKVGGHTRFGVVAQDLNAVAPEAVSAGDDGDEIEKTWGVDYSKLVPMLIKEIQSLRARVAALESA